MDKKELRKIYREKRALISDEDIEIRSEAIKCNLFQQINFSQVKTVHVFLPMQGKKEINTFKIIHHIWSYFPSIQIVVPKMVGEGLVSFIFNNKTTILNNDWGIPEPSNSQIIDNKTIDLVLLPLLAYDKMGNRIGYGKGFYDKFLTTCKPNVVKTGLSFFEPEESISSEYFDIPMNSCVTPDAAYYF